MQEVFLPDLGQDVEEATISFWHVEEGDHVEKGDDIVELTTDKSTFNVPSPYTGTVVELIGQEGQSVGVGVLLARIEEDQ